MTKVSQLPYERVAADSLIAHIENCAQKAKTAESAQALVAVRNECLAPVFRFRTMAALAFSRFTLDTRNEFYSAEKDYYDEQSPKIGASFVNFQQAFLQNPHCNQTAANVNPLVLRQYELSVKCTSQKVVPFRIEENKIVTEYTKLMAETLFAYEGENLPLSALRKYFSHPDRAVRKKAYDALGTTLAAIGEQLDDIFDRLVKVRTKIARTLGYKNFVELGDNQLGRISYGRNEIRRFRQNVKTDVVPVVAALKRALGEKTGATPFMYYDNDTYFPQGNPTPVLTAEQMFEAGKQMYHNMGKETGEFFDFMLATDAFDVFPREGKWGGGYMESFITYRQPFILANFNGTSADVDVLTHEAGHALEAYMSFRQNHDPDIDLGMETAETHSMSMEFLCYPYMDAFFGNRADDYRYAHFFDALAFLPYGTIVDYFQEQVYSQPELTPAQRNALWLELEREFRPWISYEGMPYLQNGTRWQYQMHIYESPFYYVDYCLAQSVAMQFRFMSQDNYEQAFAAYLKFVKAGATKEFPALVKEAGLYSPFDCGALSDIAAKAETILRK